MRGQHGEVRRQTSAETPARPRRAGTDNVRGAARAGGLDRRAARRGRELGRHDGREGESGTVRVGMEGVVRQGRRCARLARARALLCTRRPALASAPAGRSVPATACALCSAAAGAPAAGVRAGAPAVMHAAARHAESDGRRSGAGRAAPAAAQWAASSVSCSVPAARVAGRSPSGVCPA